ncbi:ABC-type transport system, involved in lipoprotein release, permease component [Desulfocurvibacter africanus PCS]|uniref:ABC-type transport system, involved in lipoprotein release, permease component n=1 Tax=Desulfocurvibacter africanus PCS TaxID=1262666 RepID=M5Q3G2_DESAF|nr:ABC transporter permease [Desulfocurvibacter africanus]EMG38393.1 ABC-type transport system, involved in lipoprotein release, permease component [Desulfocurvibacter africanus PCS]
MLLKILFRNALRHRLRSTLTVIGVAVAILAFGLLRTVVDAWYAGVEASSSTRLVTRNAISLIFPMPLSYYERIRRMENVEIVSYGNWFGAYYKEEKNFFANFAVQAETYLQIYPEFVITEEQKHDFLADRKGALVGAKLADRFGWRVGDTVTLIGTIFPGNWEFTIRALYRGRTRSVDEFQFLFHWDYLNETLKESMPDRADQVGFFFEDVETPEFAAATARAIDSQFENSMAETLTETEKAFQMGFVAMSEAILMIIQLVSLVVIFIILAVAANTMAMSVRERMREYAVLKTLGFGGPWLATLVLGESMLIAAAGGLLGIALTFPAAAAFREAVGQFFPVFVVTRQTVLLDALAALSVGLLAAAFPLWTALRVRIAEGLRRIG